MIQKWLWLGLLLLLPLGQISCGTAENEPRILRVGFVPAENAQEVARNAQPIVEILQRELGLEVQAFVATDYTGVVEALRANKLDMAFLTPASYVLAKGGGRRQGDPQVSPTWQGLLSLGDHYPRGQWNQDPGGPTGQDLCFW